MTLAWKLVMSVALVMLVGPVALMYVVAGINRHDTWLIVIGAAMAAASQVGCWMIGRAGTSKEQGNADSRG